jgi:arylformamidase
MQVYDISWPISSAMTAYKDKHVVAIQQVKRFEEHGARESVITISSHSGTHIDAPSHFVADGMTIDQIGPLAGVGPAHIIDMMHVEGAITAAILEQITLEPEHIILFKTRNSLKAPDAPFDPNFVYVDASAAAVLVAAGVRGVGIDYLGIERNQPDHPTHALLLQAGCTIIEGLRLHDVPAGCYFLCCLPLAVIACDGAPARAVLFENR